MQSIITHSSNRARAMFHLNCLMSHQLLFPLRQVTEELSGEVSPELFLECYNYATSEPHSFLFVDLFRKPEHPSNFRKNFDEFIITDDIQAVLDDKKSKELHDKLNQKLDKAI